ncbi:uncharacterized protein TNCV_3728151 [Trichonephila clavipes]|uniref:Uncharacterized protein n=1 Tax=Trichonephila clavipes TaxID=2585209 RepID=A0A8X6R1D1_TRICX|nr:uncharacterized protein TNCV_3728151 [Trichonephila clavipes]
MGKKYLLTIAISGYRPSIENVELSSHVQHNASPDKNSRTIVMVSFLDVTGIKPCPYLSPNQNALRIASGTEPTLIRKEDTTPLTVVQFLCSLHHCKRWCRWSTFNGRMIYQSSPAVVILRRPPPTFLIAVPVVWNAFQARETTLLLIPNSVDTLVTIRESDVEITVLSPDSSELTNEEENDMNEVNTGERGREIIVNDVPGCLEGEAATLLQSIQIKNDNYKKTWNALTERYENEVEIIHAALNKLVSQPVLKQESASGLRKLIDTTQQCIDTLQTLRQPVEYWDTLIIFLLRGKLDSEI